MTAGCALALLGSPALAQQPGGAAEPIRQGKWVALGMGFASHYDTDADEWLSGLGGRASLGGTIGDHLRLAFHTEVWAKPGQTPNDVLLLFETIDVAALFYPSASGGLHLIAGAGLSGRIAYGGSFAGWSRGGPNAFVGTGYDIPIGESMSLTPYGTLTTVFFGGAIGGKDQSYLVHLGLAVTIH